METDQHKISRTIEQLSTYESFKFACHQNHDEQPMPSIEVLEKIVSLNRSILFPGYFGPSIKNAKTIRSHIACAVEQLNVLLTDQILAGLLFNRNEDDEEGRKNLFDKAQSLAAEYISRLPKIREQLLTDVDSTFNGDPAATSHSEIIFCYPAIRAITNYRIAHELLLLGVPFIPRIITEMAHSETGIDIHPGAKIGNYFTIDHGTGVVIGATAVIGNNVRLYQGVTLGAKSFPLDEDGNPIKGIPRHPIIEDTVIIYSNATILGRITIGEGAVIGGNIWVTEDVAKGARIVQKK